MKLQIDRSHRSRALTTSLMAVLLAPTACLAGELVFNSDDTITVTAERAWEAEEPDVIHFSGNFVLRGPDWSLAGDSAVVYGKLDDPDKVVVSGNPAQVSFLRENAVTGEPDPDERVDGSAASVEYFRASDKLRMNGAARLTRKDSSLTSDFVDYDVETDRYSDSGDSGINLQFDPNDD